LVSSSGWAPAGEGAISSEDRAAWNIEVPRAEEISLLEKHHIVPIGGKENKNVRHNGMKKGPLNSTKECGRNLGG